MKRLSKEQDPANRCLDTIIMTAVVILLGRFELEMEDSGGLLRLRNATRVKEKGDKHVSRWN
jgi:hypothetical protein